MFTSPAYSALHSNNLQSRYPEGWCRLKMSNLCFLQRGCGNVTLITQFQYDAVRPDTSCYVLHHPENTETHEKGLSRADDRSGPGLCRVFHPAISHFSGDSGGHDKTPGREYWSRSGCTPTSVRPNPACVTWAPAPPSKVIDPLSFSESHVAFSPWNGASVKSHYAPIVVFRLGLQLDDWWQ